MLTYRYKLYSSKRNRKIDAMLRGLFCLEPRPRTSETLLPSYRQVLLLFEDEASFFSRNRPLPSAQSDRSGDIGAAGCRLPRFIIREMAVITHTTSYTLHQESLQPHGRTSGGSPSSGPGGLPVGLLLAGHIGRHGRGVRKVHNKDQTKTP